MLNAIISQAEALLNRVLAQDAMALAALSDITGKRIAVQLTGPDLTLYFHCHDAGIDLSTTSDSKADVSIKARPSTFIGLLISQGKDSVAFPRDMEITGDVGLAQRFQLIMKNLEIDWEEYLSHWVGDTLAHKLGNICRDFKQYSKETTTTLGLNISEYLRFEKEAVPDRSQVEEFVSAVDELRNDVERLRQRITRLANHPKE